MSDEPDEHDMDLLSPRPDLAARRASLVRMNAVTKDRTKKKKPKLDAVCEDDDNPRPRRRDHDGITRRRNSGSKKGSLKKKGQLPAIPMPFFNPQNNFQKAFKLFPDLAVSRW